MSKTFGLGCAVAVILHAMPRPRGILIQKLFAEDFCTSRSAVNLIRNILVFQFLNFKACELSLVLRAVSSLIRCRDPHQRLLLQVTLKCLGNSVLSDDESGEITGVFVGYCNNEWSRVSVGTVFGVWFRDDFEILNSLCSFQATL